MATDRQTVASQIAAVFGAIATDDMAAKWGGYMEWLETDAAGSDEEFYGALHDKVRLAAEAETWEDDQRAAEQTGAVE